MKKEKRCVAKRRKAKAQKQEGFALLLAVISLTILAVLVADLHETTGTSFAAAVAERDQLRAEYLAKSGVNLTRMLIAQERPLRLMVQSIFSMMGAPPPRQIPVWQYADAILRPFSDFDNSKEDAESAGFDLELSEGLGKTGGTFEILATAENGKVNLNDPRLADAEQSKKFVATLLSQLIAPPRYDPLFSALDDKGRTHTRSDLLANVIDWWDLDEQRTNYDPTLNAIQSSGGEDADYYRGLSDPYNLKGGPFDTLEELRLVRGMNDDIWAAIIEPDLEDPNLRAVTIWGGLSSGINVNEASSLVLLARICSFSELRSQPLCGGGSSTSGDGSGTGGDGAKFMAIIDMLRMYKVPAFSGRSDFTNFLKGAPTGLMAKAMPLLNGLLGGGGLLAGGSQTGGKSGSASGKDEAYPFTKLIFPPPVAGGANVEEELKKTFTATSKIFSIEVVGRVGRVQKRIRTVVNMDDRWAAPKPNAAQAPPLGVFAYYRVE
jgi:type II secretory pathway component PulK